MASKLSLSNLALLAWWGLAVAASCRELAGMGGRELTGAGGSGDGGGGGAPCVDLQFDPKNCGACGHDCLGGACQDGACQPYRVAQAHQPFDHSHLLVEPGPTGRVYWNRYRPNGAVFVSDKAPESHVTVLAKAKDFGWIRGVAIAGDRLLFTNYNDTTALASQGVHACALAGGGTEQLVGGGLNGVSRVEAQGAYAYFTTAFDSLALGRVPLEGGPVEPLVTLPGPEPHYDGFLSLVPTPEWVYFTSLAGVLRVRVTGVDQETLYPALGGASPEVRLAVGDDLYWADSGLIRRGSLDGAAPAEDVTAGSGGFAIREADGNLYFPVDQGIARVPADAVEAPPEVLFPALDPQMVALDEVSLFWLEHDTGEVFRVAL